MIITTQADAFMRTIHLRMPVILRPDQEHTWLEAKTAVPELLALLRPARSGALRAYEVSPAVNRAQRDTPDLIEPV